MAHHTLSRTVWSVAPIAPTTVPAFAFAAALALASAPTAATASALAAAPAAAAASLAAMINMDRSCLPLWLRLTVAQIILHPSLFAMDCPAVESASVGVSVAFGSAWCAANWDTWWCMVVASLCLRSSGVRNLDFSLPLLLLVVGDFGHLVRCHSRRSFRFQTSRCRKGYTDMCGVCCAEVAHRFGARLARKPLNESSGKCCLS